jgi:putative membrane protein
MKFLRSLITILIVIATLAVSVLFALQNKAPVSLDLLVYTFDPKSLALWVLLSLSVGGVLGMLISSGIVLRLRTSLRSVNRKLGKAQAELDSLRTAGLKDSE